MKAKSKLDEAVVVRDGYYAELYRKQTLEEEIAEIA
jgi:hypothetical protein